MKGIKIIKWALLILSVATLIGCASFTSPARTKKLESGDSYWMDYDAYRRGALLLNHKDADGNQKIMACSEPAPDAALELVNKFEAKLKTDDVELADGKVELTSKAVDLAKRTQMINFLRESLYRLCELSMNTDLSPDQLKEMYEGVSEAALDLVRVDQAEAEAEVEKAKAKRASIIDDARKANQLDQIKPFFTD